MYDDEIRNNIISNLESKAIDIVNLTVALASQGYLVNRSKYVRLDWTSILLSAFENIDVLSDEQQRKVELLYDKISTL